jgi:hypothetical protein
MPTGALRMHITDLLDAPVEGQLDIGFEPHESSPGGRAAEVSFSLSVETDFIVEELQCRGGPGSQYIVRIDSRNFRSYAFFQMIFEEKINTPSEPNFRLMVNPKRVKEIKAPAFPSLDISLRDFLNAADMRTVKPEDGDLLNLEGATLYDALGPLRKACLLNIFTKAAHASSDSCFRFLRSPLVLRQDRCFCLVDPDMPQLLRESERFKSAPNTLHDPLSGFRLEDSFKSKDAHANLQVTFMRHGRSGELAADVDLDESSGIEHGFEVIRNATTGGRTNPYVIREFMLLFDPVEKVLNPGYRFVFG